jgi:hypothetical protein
VGLKSIYDYESKGHFDLNSGVMTLKDYSLNGFSIINFIDKIKCYSRQVSSSKMIDQPIIISNIHQNVRIVLSTFTIVPIRVQLTKSYVIYTVITIQCFKKQPVVVGNSDL